MENSGRKQINSLSKAFRILDIIQQAGRPVALTEISSKTGWAKSTVYGLLATMVDNQILRQSPVDDKYSLGIRLFELGASVSRQWDILSASQTHLQHLSLISQETAFISILAETDTVLLDSVQLPGSFKIVSSVGAHSPAYCTSQGQVLLAYQPKSIYNKIVEKTHFNKFTPHTTDSPERLSAVCERIRSQGYRVEKGEYRMGLCSVSAPIPTARGEVHFALGVIGMFQDIHTPKFMSIVDEVVSAAKQISVDWIDT